MSEPASPKPVDSPSKPGASKAAPIDFSFKELATITGIHADVLYEEPVGGTLAHPPIARGVQVHEYLESLTHAPSGKKANSTSIRVCNNQLATLKGLDRIAVHLLTDPGKLTWLDASCNQLTSIDDVVTSFPELQMLYLHGNKIASLKDVQRLSQLKHLQKLTLHGNPISEKAQYKLWVTAHVPQLRSLDFSTITNVDRDKAAVWLKAEKAKK